MGTLPNLGTSNSRPVYPGSLTRDRLQDFVRLQRAAQNISSILDLDELIEKIVEEVAGWFGALESSIYLRDERDGMVLAAMRGCTLYSKGHRMVPGRGMVGHVVMTGKSHYAPDVRKDPYYVACEAATQSEVAIPLKVGDQVIGAFIASHHELDAFPPEQIHLLQALCSYVAIAVQNARRFGEERAQSDRMRLEAEEARIIQKALFPKASPYIPGFSISGVSSPACAVGGDWYDYIRLSDGRWGVVLADVSGKGMAAALLMSAARGILRSMAQNATGPGEVLSRLNSLMLEDFPSGKFVTMIYGVFDPAQRILTLANAGHPWPVLADERGARLLEGESGLPIGFAQETFPETTVALPGGTRVLFYSDGISENENSEAEEYGPERLMQMLTNPSSTTDSMLQQVRRFSGGCISHDDATLILLEALRD